MNDSMARYPRNIRYAILQSSISKHRYDEMPLSGVLRIDYKKSLMFLKDNKASKPHQRAKTASLRVSRFLAGSKFLVSNSNINSNYIFHKPGKQKLQELDLIVFYLFLFNS